MNLDALWHYLECGPYREDLPLWRAMADEAGGPVLDVGAGTGHVTVDLAARGVPVVALDTDAALLAALEQRAAGLPVETVVGDARQLALDRRFSLVLVPMQTMQLLGGARGREAFLRLALEHLEPDGILAVALADAMDCFDDEHPIPPPPAAREIAGVRYASQLLAVVDDGGRAAMQRRREIVGPAERHESRDVTVRLDRVSADEVAAEAARLGFIVEPHRYVPETEEYLGSTVVVLRAPGAAVRARVGPMRELQLIRSGRLAWREREHPALEDAGDAIVRPFLAGRCDGDTLPIHRPVSRALQAGIALGAIDPVVACICGRVPFKGPFGIGHECVAEVVAVGVAVEQVRVGQVVVVPWAVSCGALRPLRARADVQVRDDDAAHAGRIRLRAGERLVGRDGRGRGPGSVRRPHARVGAGGRPRGARRGGGRQPGRRLARGRAAADGPAGRAGADRRRRGEQHRPVCGGAGRRPRRERRRLRRRGSRSAGDRRVVRRTHGDDARGRLRRRGRGDLAGGRPAARGAGAGAGRRVHGGRLLPRRGHAVPLMRMYATDATLRLGVSHARALLPDVLAFVARTGFPAERVTTLTADWEDAPRAYTARTTKLVLRRDRLTSHAGM